MAEPIPAADSLTIPWPLVRPFETPLTAGAVMDVWQAFVRPDQLGNVPQSVEMRCLMAILRSMYDGLHGITSTDEAYQ